MAAPLINGLGAGINTDFDLRRVVGTTRGLVPEVDEYITNELKILNDLFSKRIFKRDWAQAGKHLDPNLGAPKKVTTAAMLQGLLKRPLEPRKAPDNVWANDSLLDIIEKAPQDDDYHSLSELVDATAGLSDLKYAFKNAVATNLYTLHFNERTVLGDYPAVTDFLVAYAFYVMNLTEVDAARNFITNSPAGVSKVVAYSVQSGARTYLDKAKLEVPDLANDKGSVIKSLAKAGLSLTAGSFVPGVSTVVQAPVFNSVESGFIKHAEDNGLGTIPPEMKPILIRYIQASIAAKIPITNDNIVHYAAGWIQQISRSQQISDQVPISTDQADSDFDITPFDDDRSQIQISRSAVKCASQLYYGMVLGEELQVFDAMNFFTHKYLVRGSLTIEDSRLRDDLQSYVFSNRFTDPRNKRVVDRTRPAERAMFYRQVFNYGAAPVNDEVVLNQEFPRLWKVLMLESAKFLERAQISPHPDNYVSRQNVLQSVEDLQYNLSTHCTGMSNVIAPLINAELEFVIKRIFMHPEVLRQVVPSGGTWWRVVETLILAMTGGRPKATVIYNKAKGGSDIIRAFANYEPTAFAQGQKFSEFIGNVERFITTQSILQDALTDDLVRAGAKGDPSAPVAAQLAPTTTQGAPYTAAADAEWNF